jgi:hypothetical protein
MALLAGIGALVWLSNALAMPPTRTVIRTCTLGQKSTAAARCTANPALGHNACAHLVPLVEPIIGAMPIQTANTSASAGVQCYFNVDGDGQAFAISIIAGPTVKSVYQRAYEVDGKQATTLSCDSNSGTSPPPANPPQTLSGLGDEAFSWDPCPLHADKITAVAAVKGEVSYYVFGQHPATGVSVDQLVGLVRQLMAKYPPPS